MTSAFCPFASALRRGVSRLGGTMAAFLFSLALAGCGGGGGGSGFLGDVGGNVGDGAGPGAGVVLGSGEGISEERRQGVAVKVAGLDLGGEGKVRAEDVQVSEDPEILNQNPFATAEAAPESVAEARGFERQSVGTERKTPGYKAFEVAVPADNPLMTVAVWISETAPEEEVELPEGKPERDPEAPRKFLYVRLQVYVSTRNFAAVEGGGVEVLETQVIAVEERLPDPKPPAGADECEAAGWKAARVDGNAINCLIPLTSGGTDFEGCVLAGEFEPLCSEVFGEDFVFPTKLGGEARYVFNCGEGMIPEGVNAIGATQCFSAAAVNCTAGSLPANGMTQADLNVALRLAARRGDAGQVCEMLRRGAEVNDDLNGTEFTALQEAVSEGHLGVAELLLANGAEVNARKEGAGPSALDLAARAKNAEIAAVLRAAEGRCFVESGGLCEETVVAGVCAAGTLGAGGLTQGELDAGMISAAEGGDADEVCEYLRRGADVEAQKSGNLRTALMVAAEEGHADVVELLLDNGAEVNRRGGNGGYGGRPNPGRWRDYPDSNWPALLYASSRGHADVVRIMLENGADVELGDDRKRRPLWEAAFYGHQDVMDLLLDNGADVDVADAWGITPLHAPGPHYGYPGDLEWNHAANVAEYLISRGANVNARDTWGRSPLDLYAGWNHPNAAAVVREAGGRCFVETGALCEAEVATLDPVTVVADSTCTAGSLSANGLTQAQLDANFLDAVWESEGETGEICEYLRRGANVEAQDETDRSHPGYPNHRPTGLMMAAMRGQLEVARFLLDNGADPSRRAGGNRSLGILGVNQSALVYASAWGHTEIVRLLLDRGADVNMVEGRRRGGLFEASHFGRWDVVKLLLERGANPRIADVDGNTALHGVAAHGRTTDLMDMCKNSGCPWAASPSVSPSWEKTLRTLLSADVAVNARVTRGAGVSPLDVAVQYGHEDFAGLLRAAGGRCFVESGPLCEVAVASDTVCTAGSLSKDGMTQAELDAGLIAAVRADNLEDACEYLRRGANVGARETTVPSTEHHRKTGLIIAAFHGQAEMAKLLLNNGADVNQVISDRSAQTGGYRGGIRALSYAFRDPEIVKLLLDRGADVNAQEENGRTALWEAAHWGFWKSVKLLLDGEANPNLVDYLGASALYGGVVGKRNVGVGPGGYVRFTGWRGYDLIPLQSWPKVVSLLLAAGADVNAREGTENSGYLGYPGYSSLDFAARQRYSDIAELLRGAGGRCFVRTGPLCEVAVAAPEPVVSTVVASDTVCTAGSLSANGKTQRQLDAGLISAAKANDLPGVCEHLRRGADIEARENTQRFRRTALMIAASDGFLDLAKLLYANGANVNRQAGNHRGWHNDSPGWSALHYAATAGHANIVSWLLDSGADVDARWGWGGVPGKSVLWEAAHWGRADVVKILLDRGADPEGGRDPWPLHGAAIKLFGGNSAPSDFVMVNYSRVELDSEGYATVVSLLASRVSDVNWHTGNNWTALDYAANEGQTRIAEVLRDLGGRCFVKTGPLCEVAVATPDPVVSTVVASDTVCTAGSLSADGMTGRQLTDGLVSATEANDLPKVCEYLRRGANVEAIESGSCYKRTPLMIAANDGHMELAKLLHTNGANVNRQSGNHVCGFQGAWSALMYATAGDHLELARWLLDSGAEVDAEWWHGKTSLWEAAYWGRAEIAELLIARGAAARTRDRWGNTALRMAVVDNSPMWETSSWVYKQMPISHSYSQPSKDSLLAVVSLLAAGGADVNNVSGGRSILDDAVSRNLPRFAEVLRGFGAECRAETGPLCGVAVATPDPAEVIATVVASDAICESGSLSANGMTERQLTDGLISATEGNDLPKICEYLRRGANVEAIEGRCYRRTPLMIAANDGNLDAAKLLHANGANVNRQSGHHDCGGQAAWSALMYAAAAGHLEMSRWLLDSGAEIDARWSQSKTALWEAAYWGRPEVVRLLISRGAAARTQDAWGNTALRILLYDGATSYWTKSSWQYKRDALSYSYPDPSVDENALVISLLAEAGADVNNIRGGRSILDEAVSRSFSRYAEVLRGFGAECRAETGPLCGDSVVAGDTICTAGSLSANGLTQAQLDAGLIAAVRGDNLENACEYLRRGANPGARETSVPSTEHYRKTGLMIAAFYGQLEMAKLLLNNGAEADQKAPVSNSRGWIMALPSAVRYPEVIKLLLDRGADINLTEKDGRGALWGAAHWGFWESVKLLLDRGADPNLVDTWGASALYGGVVGIRNIRDMRYVQHTGWRGDDLTPLQSWPKVVSLLLAAGADVNAREETGNSGYLGYPGYSSLDFAARRGYSEVAGILRNAGGRCFVRTGPLCGEARVAVEYSSSANGTVSADVASGGEVARGATVAFTATPAEGFYVSGWTGGCVDAVAGSVGDGGAKVCSLIAEAALSVGAVFAEVPSLAGPECPGGTMPGNGLTQAELNTQLRLAARSGDTRKICEMLRRGAEVNDNLDGNEFTALQEAVSEGHKAAAEMLLANDAHVNARKGGSGPAPLDLAAQNENAEIAQILRDAHGQCFVATGPLCGDAPAVATPEPVEGTVGITVITVTVAMDDYSSCTAGSLPASGMTQTELNAGLFLAARNNDLKGACEYLRRGANIHAPDPDNQNAPILHKVASDGEVAMAKLLLDNGASVEERGNQYLMPLHEAAMREDTGVAALLIARGADIERQIMGSPLHWAAHVKNANGISLLIALGADTMARGWPVGMLPLHYAVEGAYSSNQSKAVASARLLIAGGTDVNGQRWGKGGKPDGDSALDMAAELDLADLAAVLREAGGICFTKTLPLCSSPVAEITMTLSATLAADSDSEIVVSESRAVAQSLQEDFETAFGPAPAFGDAFGAVSSGRFLTRLDSLMRATAGTGDVWDSFYGWQKENDFGRVWFSTGQRGDFGFGAGSLGGGESGFGKVLDANPFAGLSGNGMLAGGETGFGESGKVRVAAFGDYESQSLLSGEDGKWTRWAASGTAIETAMSEAERFSGLSENKTRGAMTEFHLGGADVGVALQAGAVSESESALGGTARNESLRGLRSRTAFAGLSGSAALLGTGWRLRGAAHVGRSWAESDGMLRSSDLWASAFSAGLERGGWLYSDDGFVLRFSQPLRVEIWERELANDNGVRRMGIAPSGRQLDVDAAYRLPLSGGGWLLFSAGVRRDGGHSSGSGVEGGALFAVEKGF